MYSLQDYQYELPAHCIAQMPVAKRDASKLLVVDCKSSSLADHCFVDLVSLVRSGDLLVVNNTRVFPARLLGRKATGGLVELFILEYPSGWNQAAAKSAISSNTTDRQEVEITGLVKSSKRPKPGSDLYFDCQVVGRVLEVYPDGKVRVRLSFSGNLDELLANIGQVPLPPYISRPEGHSPADLERYQTVFASRQGAVAAPTAGLHFTEDLFARLAVAGVETAAVTLHVGFGTFAPVRVDDIRDHQIHSEYLEISEETASKINRTKAAGGRIWSVGTTTARALEFAATPEGEILPVSGLCNLYIYPGYTFKVVGNLITNFHLPQSSLLFLVCALGGYQTIFSAYAHAVTHDYRFYSYGDAMAIIVEP